MPHNWATFARKKASIHPKVVQELLCHAQISVTFDTYSHATPAMNREATSTVATLREARSHPGRPRDGLFSKVL
jgi:integrase